jgi:hypothetical protein
VAAALRYSVDNLLDLLRPSSEQVLSLIGAPGVKIDPVWNDNA